MKNAVSVPEFTQALLEGSAVLANMGVEDEYGEVVPVERVLNNKEALNFILEEPTHLKYIDASLALHAALGERIMQEVMGVVVCEDLATGTRNPPPDMEQRILLISMQQGVIGPEINEMLGGCPED